jgi:hypothetical protein
MNISRKCNYGMLWFLRYTWKIGTLWLTTFYNYNVLSHYCCYLAPVILNYKNCDAFFYTTCFIRIFPTFFPMMWTCTFGVLHSYGFFSHYFNNCWFYLKIKFQNCIYLMFSLCLKPGMNFPKCKSYHTIQGILYYSE